MRSSSIHSTAILIFARSSKEEQLHKSIYNGRPLFDALTKQVLRVAAKTRLPYFRYSEERQTGNSFGERFTNAIQEVFDRGYDQIITIGNDTPQLKATHILAAEKQLLAGKSVVGPSADGGFYLMGIHRTNFDPEAFEQLAWQTAAVSKQWLRQLKQKKALVYRLPRLYDLDSIADIKRLIAFGGALSKEIGLALQAALGLSNKAKGGALSLLGLSSPEITFNKGSPLTLSF